MTIPAKILLLFLLFFCCTAEAQYPSYQQRNDRLLPPLYLLLHSPSGLIHEQPEQADLRWDSSLQRYRGTQAEKVNYPAMEKNVFQVMEVTVLEGSANSILGSSVTADKIEDGIEMMPLGAEPKSVLYHFSEGKLSAYQAEVVYAEREAYSRHDESFEYGKNFIMHTRCDRSSGHGSSTIYCKNLPDFLIHTDSAVTKMIFDPYDNLYLSETAYSEQWDTCTCGGPQTATVKIERNENGQPLRFSQFNSREGGMTYEMLYDYKTSTFSQFSDQAKGMELYVYFNNPEIVTWLQQHKATTVERIRRTTKNYSVYDQIASRNILKPDSPSVSSEVYYIVWDNTRQPLVEWIDKPDTKGPFYFYDYEEKGNSRSLFSWSLPAVVQTKEADHCAPLYDPQPQLMSIQWQLYTNNIVVDGRYKIHSYASAGASFTGTFSGLLVNRKQNPAVIKVQMLEDEHGLIRYGWDESNIYKITYR